MAELGDKSQLLALTLATRRRAAPVLAGAAVVAVVLTGASALVGGALSNVLPTRELEIAGGAAFLVFALVTWTAGPDAAEEAAAPRSGSAFAATVLGVGVAELGDKTMLATVALAATNDVAATWAGAAIGEFAAMALAVGVGHRLGRRLPARALAAASALLFAVFGVLLLAGA